MNDTLSDRASLLGVTERKQIVREYLARRLMPKPERGRTRDWRPSYGLTPTDVYDLLHHMDLTAVIGGTRANLVMWLDEHPEYDPRLQSTQPISGVVINTVSPVQRAMTGITLDAELLRSMLQAEVARQLQGMKGEIELHVRRETQAAVSRESERAASTLMHSMAATLQTAVAEEVQRQLEEFTS